MSNKSNYQINLNSLLALISMLVAYNYFFSFKWLHGFLSLHGLDTFAIITIDDLTFPFALLNLSLFSLSSFGFLWMLWWHITIAYNENEPDVPKQLIESGRASIKWISGISKWRKILLGIVSLLFVVLFFVLFLKEENFPNSKTQWMFLVIFVVTPILYILFFKIRNYILYIHFFLMFVWANVFVNDILKSLKDSGSDEGIDVEFSYNGHIIKTNDTLDYVYHGYKYMILSDNKNDKKYMYPSEEIGVIGVKKKLKDKTQ